MNKAYSQLEIRSVDEDKREIVGIASTPTVDSYNTSFDPRGAQYTLPMPFLLHHDSKNPIGDVVEASVSDDGIRVRIVGTPAGVSPAIDDGWRRIKAKNIRGLSIGFEPIKEEFDKSFKGIRFVKWLWRELSAVTLAANVDASIKEIRSADEAILAASGIRERTTAVRLNTNLPASGPTQGKAMKNLKEHIAALTAKREANDKRMDEIIQKAADEARSRDAAEQEEYDGLKAENTSLKRDIDDYTEREKEIIARAAAVETKPGVDPEKQGQQQRQGRPAVEVRKNEPKGIGMARVAIAMVRAGNNPYHAAELAKQYWKESPEVEKHIRAVIEAGDTTTSGWASQLVPSAQQMNDEFLEMLREAMIIGRIPGLRRVPFNVAVPLQSGGGTYGYVGEGAPKPVTKPTYGSATLRFEKAAGIIVITEELARFSRPDAEMLVRDEMIKGLSEYFDTVFVSADAAVTNVKPAGILNGISATAASATTAAGFRVNMNTVLQTMLTNKRDPADLVILMGSKIAMSLGSMMNSLGQQEFPTISAQGGNYLGIPIIISGTVGTNIIVLDPGDILLAEDPAVRIDVSREASVEMDSTPAAGETSPITEVSTLKSFWQNNLVGIRAEQFRTWKVARSSAVGYISGAAYAPTL